MTQQERIVSLVKKGWMVRRWYRAGRHSCCRMQRIGRPAYCTVTPTGRVVR